MATVKETVQSGIKPITIDFSRVRFFENGKTLYRSFLTVNSLDLGVLGYDQYRFVARRTKVGEQLVRRHLEKLFRHITYLPENETEVFCFTVPVYARLLNDNLLASMLMDMKALYPEVPMNKVCIELSADILYEDLAELSKCIDVLRDIGVKIALCEVGDQFCPTFRLSEIKFDYAFLDTYTTNSLAGPSMERIAGSMVKYLHYIGVTVIAPMLDTDEKIEAAKAVEADGYTDETFIPAEDKIPDDVSEELEKIKTEETETEETETEETETEETETEETEVLSDE